MKEFAVYTLARIGMFVAAFLVISGVWMLVTRSDAVPWLWPLLLAALASGVGSYYLLQGPRQRFAARIEGRASTMARRFEEMRAKEDED